MNEIQNMIYKKLDKAVNENDEDAVREACRTLKNYYITLHNCLTKKTCSRCGKLLPDSEFSICKSAFKGLSNSCKNCNKEYLKKWYQENKDIVLYTREKYRGTHQADIRSARRVYNRTMQGKIKTGRNDAKRRGLGFNLLYDIPQEWDARDYCFHHINDIDVVAMPKKIHGKYKGKRHRERLEPFVTWIYS